MLVSRKPSGGYHPPLQADNGTVQIRGVRQDELPALAGIERAAGQCFREIGMAQVADDEPFSLEVLVDYHSAGRAWVAVDGDDAPVGYLVADLVDGNVHVEQVSVHPRWSRRGIGRRLIDHVADDAAARGVPALTLTTFADVPWNGPYYLRCGFVVMDDGALTPGLRAIRGLEAAHGLDRWPRVCMRRNL